MSSELWNGYELIRFDSNGHDSLICLPKNPQADRPWVWRAEFFGAFPSVDLAMLEKGYAVPIAPCPTATAAPRRSGTCTPSLRTSCRAFP